MRRICASLLLVLVAAAPAEGQQEVKPDEAVVGRLVKALGRREVDAVRAAPKLERFEALARALGKPSRDLRALAAEEMAVMGEPAAAALLVHAIVREADAPLRGAMTRSLRALGAGDAAALFAAFLRDSLPHRRLRAMQGLAVFRDRRAVAPLVARIEEIVVEAGGGKANAAFTVDHAYIRGWRLVSGGTGLAVVEVADPEVDIARTGAALEVNVRKVEMRFAAALIEDLTGQRLGADAARWRAWLAANRDFALAPAPEDGGAR